MRRGYNIFLTGLLAVVCGSVAAQTLDASYYEYPLRDVAGYYSANFGEMRPNHFHGGTDLKTDGVEGKVVVAAADGYVARVSRSPWGYGLALYINHPNGTTTVYGHLSRFRKDIADFVFAERHRTKRNSIDVTCSADQFKVKRGEEIARSGNTGASMGPHLHYELRTMQAQKTLNIIAQGVLKPKDNISPYIMKLHYIEVDTVKGVPMNSEPRTFAVRKVDDTNYALAQQSPVKVGRQGYFVVETSDRKNDCANTYGIYRLKAQLDGKTIFEYLNDGFTFDLSRYCNAISYYPIQRRSRNEAIRLAAMQGGVRNFYTAIWNRGMVKTSAGQMHNMSIEVTDDCGNSSSLVFDVEGMADAECFKGEIADDAKIVYYNHDFAAKADDTFSVVIPKGSLYESMVLPFGKVDITPKGDDGIRVLSPVYRVSDSNIPLQSSIAMVFTVPVDEALQSKTVMASVSDDGSLSCAGGSYRRNRLTGRTSSFGAYCLAADVVPPVVTPLFDDGADCRKRDQIAFRMSDNFSGVASYTVTIDGEWVAADYYPSRGRVIVDLQAEGIKGERSHAVEITLADECGNTAVWRGNITR